MMTLWILHASYSSCVSMASADRGLESHMPNEGSVRETLMILTPVSELSQSSSRTQRFSRPLAEPNVKDIFLFWARNQPTKYPLPPFSHCGYFFSWLFNKHLSQFTCMQSLNSTHLSTTRVIYAEHV